MLPNIGTHAGSEDRPRAALPNDRARRGTEDAAPKPAPSEPTGKTGDRWCWRSGAARRRRRGRLVAGRSGSGRGGTSCSRYAFVCGGWALSFVWLRVGPGGSTPYGPASRNPLQNPNTRSTHSTATAAGPIPPRFRRIPREELERLDHAANGLVAPQHLPPPRPRQDQGSSRRLTLVVGIRAWPPLTRWRGVRMHGGIRRWGRVRTCLSNSNPTDQNASELSSVKSN